MFVFMSLIVVSASAGNMSSKVFVRGFLGCPKVNCVCHGVKKGVRMRIVPYVGIGKYDPGSAGSEGIHEIGGRIAEGGCTKECLLSFPPEFLFCFLFPL